MMKILVLILTVSTGPDTHITEFHPTAKVYSSMSECISDATSIWTRIEEMSGYVCMPMIKGNTHSVISSLGDAS
jgi:hypothetical protein